MRVLRVLECWYPWNILDSPTHIRDNHTCYIGLWRELGVHFLHNALGKSLSHIRKTEKFLHPLDQHFYLFTVFTCVIVQHQICMRLPINKTNRSLRQTCPGPSGFLFLNYHVLIWLKMNLSQLYKSFWKSKSQNSLLSSLKFEK